MTGDAKKQLSKTIRSLRADLLGNLANALDGEYLLSISAEDARLDERRHVRRQRLENWVDEQVRGLPAKQQKGARERFLADVVKEAAYTWLNRLVVLRILEANGHTKETVVSGGWSSSGQRRFRDAAHSLARVSETEGYATLLQLVFDELALQMPGLFGDIGLVKLVPMPPATLRLLVDALDDAALDSCWTDNTALGWVYQYWNDPEREDLDAKINARGKIEPHEIASKTQLFTEQYMVEWLLQNSLNQMWLAICAKNEWTPECESDGVLDRLEARREDWREKREAGEVELDELMPIHGDAEEQWKYWVPQPLPGEVVEKAPSSLRDIKLLDPACGSGHFLVASLDLLMAFYREEARHRGERWSDVQIATWILEDNLHGIDIDPRAVQIAAAALILTARNACSADILVDRLNLVAPTLRLSALPDDDEAVVELRQRIHEETGLAEPLTNDIMRALKGADHLGTLLRIDDAINEALREHLGDGQVGLFETPVGLDEGSDAMRERILTHLDSFLNQHASAEDLGLRLRGEQLAAGVRFLELMREGSYDVVIGNPPYQGTSKMADKSYVKKHYPRGKADLFACFLERGLELVREGGVSAMVTMRNWMFIKQYQDLREHLLENFDLRLLGDFDRGAFEHIPDEVVSVALTSLWRRASDKLASISVQPTPLDDSSRDNLRTPRKRAAVLAQVGRFEFRTDGLKGIEGWPLVYWWGPEFTTRYVETPKLGDVSPARKGLCTGYDARFIRFSWELSASKIWKERDREPTSSELVDYKWFPTIHGAKGVRWFEPLKLVTPWGRNGLEFRAFKYVSGGVAIRNVDYYFKPGVAFSMIGLFSARAHRYRSVFGNKGSSVFPSDIAQATCLMNSSEAQYVLGSLNPGVGSEVGDVNRLPVLPVAHAGEIFSQLEEAFTTHESTRECSVEFKLPASSPWKYAQNWAQQAIDRSENAGLPNWLPELAEPVPEHWLSWSLGVAIGRFDREKGALQTPSQNVLGSGIFFLSEATGEDSLDDYACELLHEMWSAHGDAINDSISAKSTEDLRTWLRKRFFDEVHRPMYENAPIYFPLSSAKKSFVVFVSIHRWTADTLRILQADHLRPERQRIEGQIDDLQATPEDERSRDDQKRLDSLRSWLEELNNFIDMVEQCAEKGPPAPDSKTREREMDAQYDPVLDDGTMINSAALWPLLEPQWKKPKKWWKELALAKGNKDYDWSMLAAKYFPTRVDEKCQEDPSLAVAHGCFWRYHPEKAYAWELRLQDEIEADFLLDEEDSDSCRQAFLLERLERATELREDELQRRLKKAKKNDEDVDEDELRAQLGLGFSEGGES